MNRSHRILTILTFLAVAAPLASLLLAGCHVTENDHEGSHDVRIGTPFGSMRVNTGSSIDATSTGISAYPGATPVQGEDGGGDNANVHMSIGSFRLGAKIAEFQTADSAQKVLAFYRKDLAERYGAPVECRNHNPVGPLHRTAQGLTCNESPYVLRAKVRSGSGHTEGVTVSSEDSSTALDLQAGSPQRMHVVSVENRDGGTRISLVSIDLPTGKNGSDSE